MREISFALVLLLAASLAFNGCVPQQTGQVQQQVSIAQEPPPPSPPTSEELQKPPSIILEKPVRDPFMPLTPGGGPIMATPSGKKGPGMPSVSEGYSLVGIMSDRESSAIIQSGANSYIVHSGDKIGGYRVGSISPKKVVLVGKGGKLSLSLPSGP